jgi:GNAT superfamily N-acetyltransferase
MAWDDEVEKLQRDLSSFDLKVVEADKASAKDLENVFSLFEMNYRQANRAYLEESLGTLRYLALAEHEGTAAGFALGECRVMDLPRLPAEVVNVAGICCVAPQFRRRGVFRELEYLIFVRDEMPAHARRLSCGRMAHPAGMQGFIRIPTVVPKPGVRPTPWQQEVGQAIADAFGSHAFDPETFVCIGSGEPIGYPIIEFQVEPIEWEVFRQVNRDRGDSLLAMVWTPDAPPGW